MQVEANSLRPREEHGQRIRVLERVQALNRKGEARCALPPFLQTSSVEKLHHGQRCAVHLLLAFLRNRPVEELVRSQVNLQEGGFLGDKARDECF